MVLSFKAGSWTSRATVGNDTITGVGFTPKVVIIFSTAYYVAFNSIDSYTYVNIGAAADTTAANQKCIFAVSEDAVGTSVSHQAWNTAAACNAGTGDGNTTVGSVSALGADGFTFNWTTIARATKNEYMCFGGADITNAKVGVLTTPLSGATGTVAYTGVGFQPDVLIFFGNAQPTSGTTAATGYNQGIGFATSASNQGCLANLSKHGVTPMQAKHYQRGDNAACFALIDNGTTTNVGLQGTLTTMGSDGFSINWTTVAAAQASLKLNYVAIKGGNWKVGSFTTPTTGTAPVSQSTSGVGFQPTGLFLASGCGTAATTVQAHNHTSLGAGSSSANYLGGFTADNDAVATSQTMNINKTSPAKIASMYTVVANEANSTVKAEAGLSTLDADGFTLSWTTRDANAYQLLYLAAGSTAAVTGARNLQIGKGWFYSDN